MNGMSTKRALAKEAGRANAQNGHSGDQTASNAKQDVINGESNFARTTAVFPIALNENWEAYALTKGVAKNEVLVIALTKFLEDAGFQPSKRPKLQVSY